MKHTGTAALHTATPVAKTENLEETIREKKNFLNMRDFSLF